MVDKDFSERFICGQWSELSWIRDFHLGFYAVDQGQSC